MQTPLTPQPRNESRPRVSQRRSAGTLRISPKPTLSERELSERQWQVLRSIPEFGGMVPGYLLAMLHYPPRLTYSLNFWVKNMELVKAWMVTYPVAYLDDQVKYLRFLRHLNRIWSQKVLKKSTDIALWQWWETVEEREPEACEQIMTHRWHLSDLERMSILEDGGLVSKQYALEAQNLAGESVEVPLLVIQHLLHLHSEHRHALTQLQDLEELMDDGYDVGDEVADAEEALRALAANQWLTLAIDNGFTPPPIFAERPQYPSQFVSSWASQQFQQLIDARLADVYRPTGMKGNSSASFYLSRKGRRRIAKLLDKKVKEVNWKAVGSYVYQDYEHRIAQSELRVACTLAAQRMGYEVEWLDTLDLERILKGVTVTLERMLSDERGRTQLVADSKLLRIPDNFVWVDTQQGWVQPMVIELDNNSETIVSEVSENTIAMKYRTWSVFCQEGMLKQYFKDCEQGVWHLMVTTGSERRMRNIQAAAMDVVGRNNPAKDRYWFACLGDVKPTYKEYWAATVFTEAIWLRGDATEFTVLDVAAQAQREQAR